MLRRTSSTSGSRWTLRRGLIAGNSRCRARNDASIAARSKRALGVSRGVRSATTSAIGAPLADRLEHALGARHGAGGQRNVTEPRSELLAGGQPPGDELL